MSGISSWTMDGRGNGEFLVSDGLSVSLHFSRVAESARGDACSIGLTAPRSLGVFGGCDVWG